MPAIRDEYRLKRAWSYTSPRYATDTLPVVYGAMTGGSKGLWDLVCIDSANFVYAAAGHAVLSVGDGNAVTVYDKDGAVIGGANYTFDESNDYAGQGVIATITFTGDRESDEPVSVRMQGREDGSGSLIENPIDIVEDFLIELAGFGASDLNSTFLERARSLAQAESLKMSGLITGDRQIGTTLSEMLFPLGDWWTDKDGLICIRLELPSVYLEGDVAAWVHSRHQDQARVEARLDDVVNRVEASYRYNRRLDKFESGDDGDGSADALSQNLFGERRASIDLAWIRDADTAEFIQENLVERFKEPPRIFSFIQRPPRSVFVERGDVVSFSSGFLLDPELALTLNQMAVVLEASLDPVQGESAFRLRILEDKFLTTAELLDGSWTLEGSVRLGGDRDTTPYF